MRKLAALVLALLFLIPAPAAWAEVTRAQLAEAEAQARAKSAELDGRPGELEAATYQAWFASLMAFRPAFPPELASSATRFALDWHMLFVDAFLIYFPFSKLTHAVGAFATNLVRTGE